MEEFELREPPHPAYMTVIAAGVPESPYEIVSTDYVTYSCVHSCLEYFGFKAEFMWVLGRTPHISPEYVTHCHESFAEFGVDPTKLVDIPHGEPCPYMKKLDSIFERNHQLLINLGVLEEDAPPFTYIPPPPVEEETVEVEEEEEATAMEEEEGTTIVEVMDEDEKVTEEEVNIQERPKPEIPVVIPETKEETVLEEPQPEPEMNNSSPPSKTSSIAIPLFVLVAVLLPTLAR